MLGRLHDLLAGFPGQSDVVIELTTTAGRRRLKLGPSYRVTRGAGLHAEPAALLGAALLSESAGPSSDAAISADEPEEPDAPRAVA